MNPVLDTSSGDTVVEPPTDAEFRKAWWHYVTTEAEPAQRIALTRLLDHWTDLNNRFYGGVMIPPYILLAEPSNPRRFADAGPISGFGGRCQIRIRPSLLRGTYPGMASGGDHAEGRFLFVADVLAHEQIHQWQQEVTGRREHGDHGHGSGFAAKANEIGAAWGLPPVRRRGGAVNCAHWPHNVRPLDHYRGAYRPRVPRDTPPDTASGVCPACGGSGRTSTEGST